MASEELPTLNVRMAPPADTWPEIVVELRSWREEVVLATKACVTLVQQASDTVVDKATKSMEQLCGHGQGQSVSYSSTEDASSIIVRVLQPEKPDLDTIVGRIRLMRTTMRKEAHLECDAIARTFDAGLEKLLTGVELFLGTNSSSFATAFAHPPPKFNVRVGTTDRPFPTIASAVQNAVSWEEEERQKVRQFAMDLQVQVFERLATHATRMCAH
eukprot:CAMPEP_0194490858 /NCGR_PEP_ID=MMETSP0253-20130528/9934_1 /TAXON_ID=2966 /ORGANISM="Noctiluca scintillans" /LENGTH=214 /DNA_ID=CAMNT_0039331539 /DNA_START=31 /DNA_END=675 /DNA_ORIENTATION=-